MSLQCTECTECPCPTPTPRDERDILGRPDARAHLSCRSVRCGAPHATPRFTYTGSMSFSRGAFMAHGFHHSLSFSSGPTSTSSRRNQPSRIRLAPRPWRARPPLPMPLAKQAVQAAGLQGRLAAAQAVPPLVLLPRRPNAEVAAWGMAEVQAARTAAAARTAQAARREAWSRAGRRLTLTRRRRRPLVAAGRA